MKQISLIGAGAFIVLTSCSPQPAPAPADESLTTPMFQEEVTNIEHVTIEQAVAIYRHRGDLVVLDGRTPTEYNEGHIPGALNFSFTDPKFAEQIAQLNRARPYLVHGGGYGLHSTNALDTFNQEHFQKIYHLDGGWEAWRSLGYPSVPSPR